MIIVPALAKSHQSDPEAISDGREESVDDDSDDWHNSRAVKDCPLR
jgi:hypothetical protein